MSIWQWCDLLPALPREQLVSLGEGNTPLTMSRRIGPDAGLSRLYFKLETTNPSGSFKDRFAAAAISHMRAAGQTRCVATSSGNTGSALAAYCAAAAIECKIAVVETAPQEKLIQMLAHGAKLYRIRGFGIDPSVTEQTFETLVRFGDEPAAALQISAFKFSPLGMSGVESISYEIAEQTDSVDHVFVPAGGGGLTVAVARGFERLSRTGRLRRRPKVHCVQPVGNDTIAGPLRSGRNHARNVSCTTAISGLQVPSVIDGDETIAACSASGGSGYSVEDEQVYTMQRRLAQEEGIFCEPAGAVSVAGALDAVRRGEVDSSATTVCLITGSGFKDLASAKHISEDRECATIDLPELMDVWRRS